MASSPLTLAALATSAVPGLVVHGTREHVSEGGSEFTSAVLVCEDDDLIVRLPRTSAAEVRQSAELLALSALTTGARSRLPFTVSEPRGVTRAGDTRAVVSTFVRGDRVATDALEPDALLIDSIAAAIAAIHELPHGIAHQNGLTVRSAEDARLSAARIVERAESTRLLPKTVQSRWTETLQDADLWDFAPALVHGSLDLDQLLVEDDQITGVLGWSELSVGDPALDLAWLSGSGRGTLDQVLHRYAAIRGVSGIEQLRARVVFYHQLEVARWLLHGVEQHDGAIIEDAVAMLDQLVDRMSRGPRASTSHSPLGTTEVSKLLDDVPEVSSALSDTAAYEALDEDRRFHVDTDFIEPVEKSTEADDEGSEAGSERIEDERAAAMSGSTESEAITEVIDPLEQETEPIDPDDLPTPRGS